MVEFERIFLVVAAEFQRIFLVVAAEFQRPNLSDKIISAKNFGQIIISI